LLLLLTVTLALTDPTTPRALRAQVKPVLLVQAFTTASQDMKLLQTQLVAELKVMLVKERDRREPLRIRSRRRSPSESKTQS
jgi:hypothetical protein